MSSELATDNYFDLAKKMGEGHQYEDLLISEIPGLSSDPYDRQKQAFFALWYRLYKKIKTVAMRELVGYPANLKECAQFLGISRQTLGVSWPKTRWFQEIVVPDQHAYRINKLFDKALDRIDEHLDSEDDWLSHKAAGQVLEYYKAIGPQTPLVVNNIDNANVQQNNTITSADLAQARQDVKEWEAERFKKAE